MATTEKQKEKIRSAIVRRKIKKDLGKNVPRINKRPAQPLPPEPQERNFLRLLRSRIERNAKNLVNEVILEQLPQMVEEGKRDLRADAIGDTITSVISGVKIAFERQVQLKDLAQLAAQIGLSVASQNAAQQKKVFRSVLGVDPVRTEPWFDSLIENFVRDNVSLIKTVPERYFDKIERIIRDGISGGRSKTQIAKQIRAAAKPFDKNAAFIARDQVSKLNGKLTRLRQKEVGVQKYRWRTQRDARVRPASGNVKSRGGNHRRLEGKIFDWDNPPLVDRKSGRRAHPGEDFNCRCWAEPIFEPFKEEAQKLA